MPRDYQPRYDPLPHNVYMQVLYLIRDYDRMKAEYDTAVDESPQPPDGMPRSSGPSDPTANKAIRLDDLGRRIRAVEAGIETIPEEYRKSIWNNICYRIPYDTRYTSYQTFRYHRQKMILTIARRMSLWK